MRRQGSTAFIAPYEIDSGQSACTHLQCTIVSSTNAPLTLDPVTFTSSSGLTFVSAFGDITAGALRSSTSTNVGSEIDLGMKDTYTVGGTAAGPFSITATLHATGFFSSAPNGPVQIIGAGQVKLDIGTLVIDPAANDFPIVAPFDPVTTQAQQSVGVIVQSSPFTVPIDVSVSYTKMVSVGSVFDLAFGMVSTIGKGGVDLSHTAAISFDTPDGVFLTSAMGGRFGDVPSGVVPLPAAWIMMLSGIAGFAGFRFRRSARA